MTASITDDRRSSTGFFFSALSGLLDDDDDDDDCRLGWDPPWTTLITVENESCTVDLRIRDDDDEDAIVLRARLVAMASVQLNSDHSSGKNNCRTVSI